MIGTGSVLISGRVDRTAGGFSSERSATNRRDGVLSYRGDGKVTRNCNGPRHEGASASKGEEALVRLRVTEGRWWR